MGKTGLSSQLECWKILDIYLHARNTTTQKSLLAMEAAAAAIMWDLIKPFFNKHELFMNTRMLERRVLDQYLFSSIKTAAKTKGNVLVNYYFKKCEEHARLFHAIQLLGWMGTLGLHHGRTRKTALDVMGLVVDLNENFKLLFLLGLLNEIKAKDVIQTDVRAWIGRKRMYNYYVGWDSMDSLNEKIVTMWNYHIKNEDVSLKKEKPFDWMKALGLDISTLREEYGKQLEDFKRSCIFLALDLGCDEIHQENAIALLEKIEELDLPTQKLLKIKSIGRGSSFEPFVVKSNNIPFPDENDWVFFQAWSELIRPVDHRVRSFMNDLHEKLARYCLHSNKDQVMREVPIVVNQVLHDSELHFLTTESEHGFTTGLVQSIMALFAKKQQDNKPRTLLALIEKHVHDVKKYITFPITEFKTLLQEELIKACNRENLEDLPTMEFKFNHIIRNVLGKTRITIKNEGILLHFMRNIFHDLFEIHHVQESAEYEFMEGVIESNIHNLKNHLVYQQVEV